MKNKRTQMNQKCENPLSGRILPNVYWKNQTDKWVVEIVNTGGKERETFEECKEAEMDFTSNGMRAWSLYK